MLTSLRRCLVVILCLLCRLCDANPVAAVQTGPDSIVLDPYIEIFVDPTATLSIAQVRQQSAWAKTPPGYPNFGFSRSAVWLRFRVANTIDPPPPLLLKIGSAILDEVDFYQFRADKLIRHVQVGADRPAAQRIVAHRNFVLPVTTGVGGSDDIYVRIRSATSIQTVLTLWRQQAFWEHDQKIVGIHGLYYGAILFILFYHFVLYLRLGERFYLNYICNVLALTVAQLWMDGIGAQLLWLNTPFVDEIIPALAPPVIMICYFMFLKQILRLDQLGPGLNRLASLNLLVAVADLMMAPLLSIETFVEVIPAMITFAAISALFISYAAWFRSRKSYARTVAMSSTAFLLSVILVSMISLDAVPMIAPPEYALMAGSAIEMFMLAYALSERLSEMDQQRLRAERDLREVNEQLLASARRNSSELEHEVDQRTQDLTQAVAKVERLNRQLAELSITDPLTGAKNRRYFDAQLAQELQRARRDASLISLIMIDIDHFKQVNDKYGHPAGDECLRGIAKAIQGELRRPPDELCRIGGEEMAVILPGTPLDGAVKVAERMRLAVEALQMNWEGSRYKVTASFGVSCKQPAIEPGVSDLLANADKALYQAKLSGRNRVCQEW